MAHSIFSFLLPGEVDFRPTVLSGCAPKSRLICTHAAGVPGPWSKHAAGIARSAHS